MKKEMDIRLYKYEIIKGKEETAEEWLNFLNVNRKAGEALLKDEMCIRDSADTHLSYFILQAYLIPDCVNPLTTYLLANMKIIRTGTTDTRVDAIIRPGFV